VPWLRSLVASLSPRRPGFEPSQSMWDLWWTNWHWDKFFSSSVFLCQHIIPPSLSKHLANALYAGVSRHPRLGLTHLTFRRKERLIPTTNIKFRLMFLITLSWSETESAMFTSFFCIFDDSHQEVIFLVNNILYGPLLLRILKIGPDLTPSSLKSPFY
jgi:hypothetical protein